MGTETTLITLNNLSKQLESLANNKATGRLVLQNGNILETLDLVHGRLLFIRDSVHRVRRISRAIQKNCPKWEIKSEKLSKDTLWEYDLLYQAICQKQIGLSDAKAIIASVAEECLFELGESPDTSSNWKAIEDTNTQLSLGLALSPVEIQTVITKVKKLQEDWKKMGLGNISPSFVPKLKEGVKAEEISVLEKYINGRYTLWDIALRINKPVNIITRHLVPLVSKQIIEFKRIGDLSAPFLRDKDSPSEEGKTPETPQKKINKENVLVACIDDSPIVAYTLKKILEPEGYKVLVINEPMHGFAKLIDNKPDFIFLDLNMPNANGYSVCQFLRNTPVFENTPIIILTGQDTLIDRARAKLVGATDFIAKPPTPDTVLGSINKYLLGVDG
jgi:two-component system, chemotaxis family, response regulator PixG